MTSAVPESGAGDHGERPLVVDEVSKQFKAGGREVQALDGVSLELRAGTVNGLLGPDGAGKTTLIRLAAGLLIPDKGSITVLGLDSVKQSAEIQAGIGYMPQRFGLYEDLSVMENLQLYADLQSVSKAEREERYPKLMNMTGLAPFTKRLAGKLSGGMKQKLGLACSLIKIPELLLLDEPTVGVDPLSRRELWEIVYSMVEEHGLTVLLSTAYLDEAERCEKVVVLNHGQVLGQDAPAAITARAQGMTFEITSETRPRDIQSRLIERPDVTDASIHAGKVRVVVDDIDALKPELPPNAQVEAVQAHFEDGFLHLLKESMHEADSHMPDTQVTPRQWDGDHEKVIEVRGLTRTFGDFYAVKDVDLDVNRGEIFGLLGPNGAGKSTTFRMMCGLLPASDGHISILGVNLRTAAALARKKIGYVAQKFSQYGQLSVRENLQFFSAAYGLTGKRRKERINWALESLELADVAPFASGNLPFGYKQRLAMACALMHEPEILFLDEATSGVDPLGRRRFWKRITSLADAGITIVVTTHFMEEAEYCDRMAVIVAGEILAIGEPDEIRAKAPKDKDPTIEEAFISLVEKYREEHT